MHEYSIVQSLLTLCEENAKTNDIKKISAVEVKIGVLSGVEPELLKTAFDTFKEKTICEDAEFIMHLQPLKVRCFQCEKESELKQGEYSCPICQSTEVDVIDGEDMYLMRIVAEG